MDGRQTTTKAPRRPGSRSRRGLLLVALSCLLAACGAAERRRPNLVIIVMDTTRADRCSITGYSRQTTPRLEDLAERGTLYLNAWSPSSWTAPAHASFFTGLRPEHHGLMHGTRPFLSQETPTLATILGRNGYRSACLSNNPMVSPAFGLTQGFDTYESVLDLEDPGYPTARWAHDRAVEWVGERLRLGEPYYLFVNDMEPHAPYTPVEPYQERLMTRGTDPGMVKATRGFFSGAREVFRHVFGKVKIPERQWQILSDLYDAEIATLDEEIGDLVERLEDVGALENTVLVVLGDHGENLGDHGLGDHVLSLHRTLLHVPLLVVGPGFRPGAAEEAVVRLEDLFPTLLASLDLPVPEGLDGEDFRDVAPGRIARAVLGRTLNKSLLQDFPGIESDPFLLARRSVYDGRMHLIQRQDGLEELYDVTRDPDERQNLATSDPGEVRRLIPLLPSR